MLTAYENFFDMYNKLLNASKEADAQKMCQVSLECKH